MTAAIARENPAHPDEVVGTVPVATARDVDAAVARADAVGTAWRARSVEDRASLLISIAGALDATAEDTTVLLARELGKVLADCRGELAFSHAWLRWVASRAPAVLAPTTIDDDQGRLLLERIPYGVVAAVTPWNAPVVLAMLKVAPALVTGNTIVVKPSPLAPLAVTRVLQTMAGALPDGVLQVVNGDADTGAALVANAHVRRVAFTGGGAVARAIAQGTADRLTPMVLELSGNDPAVLLADALLDAPALERLLFAAFATTGQVCMAVKRLYVHRSRFDELVSGLQRVAATALITGDPLAQGVTMGPLVTRAAADRVQRLADHARAGGAAVVELGTLADASVVADGYFVRPSLVLGAGDDAAVVREEQFGPLLPVLVFDDEDDVVRRANDSELGLAASVWSADEEHAVALARRLEAGFRFVNTHNRTGLTLRAPFGGVKASGYGREYGEEGIREYTQTCVVHVPAAFRGGASALAGSAYPVE